MKCDQCGTENWEGNACCGKCSRPFHQQRQHGLAPRRLVSLLLLCSAFAGAAGFAAATYLNQQAQGPHATMLGTNHTS
jgi:hypothetical protein